MLKDITLGQYFPGNTVIHRLDPRTKIWMVIFYIVALFTAKWFVSYAVMLVFLIVAVRISKVAVSAQYLLHPGRTTGEGMDFYHHKGGHPECLLYDHPHSDVGDRYLSAYLHYFAHCADRCVGNYAEPAQKD